MGSRELPHRETQHSGTRNGGSCEQECRIRCSPTTHRTNPESHHANILPEPPTAGALIFPEENVHPGGSRVKGGSSRKCKRRKCLRDLPKAKPTHTSQIASSTISGVNSIDEKQFKTRYKESTWGGLPSPLVSCDDMLPMFRRCFVRICSRSISCERVPSKSQVHT